MSQQKKKTTPIAVTLLCSQVKQGIYPTKDVLNQVFNEVDAIYYKDIAFALLDKKDSIDSRMEEPKQERVPVNPERRTSGLTEGGQVEQTPASGPEMQRRNRWG